MPEYDVVSPYLLNSWYIGAWAEDVADKPVGVRMLDEDIVLFRDADGVARAIQNRCSHRFAPLSMGRVTGGMIECPYHGLRFDGTGQCIFNPHGRQTIPPHSHLNSWPVVEKHRALWLWMGDPALADPAAIIPLTFLDDDRYAVATGHLKVNADYRLLNDNLLDLTHAAYLHPTTVGYSAEDSIGPDKYDYHFETEGDVVRSQYTVFDVPATAQFLGLFDRPTGDFRAHLSWYPASCMLLDLSMASHGAPKPMIDDPRADAVLIPGAHLIVPETLTTAHYFYALARSADIDDVDTSQRMHDIGKYTFSQEDAPVVEACQRLMGGEDFWALRPVILETDIAGLQARRILKRLVAAQRHAERTTVATVAAAVA